MSMVINRCFVMSIFNKCVSLDEGALRDVKTFDCLCIGLYFNFTKEITKQTGDLYSG